MRGALLLMLLAPCFGQVHGNLPTLRYGGVQGIIGGTPGQVLMYEGVTSGELVVVCSSAGIATSSPVSWPLTDSGGVLTFTNLTPIVIPQGSQSNFSEIQISYAVASGTVATDTVSGLASSGVSFQGPNMTFGVFDNISGTVDGSGATATDSTNNSSGLTATPTTTGNGSLLVGCSGFNGTSGLGHTVPSPGANVQYVARDNYQFLQGYAVAGLAGAQSFNVLNNPDGGGGGGGNGQPTGLQVIAFKPTALTIATTAMPDGGQNIAYSSQLKAVGGSGAYTWSVSAGSCTGLSMTNTATGIYSGTPSVIGTCALTFQVTDGSATVTKALNVKIGATLNTPSVRSTLSIGTIGIGSTSVTAFCGDSIIVWLHGSSTHGTTGWVSTQNGVNNFVKESYGLTPQRIYPLGGSGNAPVVGYMFGPIPKSGLDTISYSNNTSSANVLSGVIEVASGVQSIVDPASFAALSSVSTNPSYTLSTSLNLPVPNELFQELFVDDQAGQVTVSSDTIAMSAPLSVAINTNGTYDNLGLGTALVGASGTQSTTTTVTTTMHAETAGAIQIGLRPAIIGNACIAFVGAGEKSRRPIY